MTFWSCLLERDVKNKSLNDIRLLFWCKIKIFKFKWILFNTKTIFLFCVIYTYNLFPLLYIVRNERFYDVLTNDSEKSRYTCTRFNVSQSHSDSSRFIHTYMQKEVDKALSYSVHNSAVSIFYLPSRPGLIMRSTSYKFYPGLLTDSPKSMVRIIHGINW